MRKAFSNFSVLPWTLIWVNSRLVRFFANDSLWISALKDKIIKVTTSITKFFWFVSVSPPNLYSQWIGWFGHFCQIRILFCLEVPSTYVYKWDLHIFSCERFLNKYVQNFPRRWKSFQLIFCFSDFLMRLFPIRFEMRMCQNLWHFQYIYYFSEINYI